MYRLPSIARMGHFYPFLTPYTEITKIKQMQCLIIEHLALQHHMNKSTLISPVTQNTMEQLICLTPKVQTLSFPTHTITMILVKMEILHTTACFGLSIIHLIVHIYLLPIHVISCFVFVHLANYFIYLLYSL